MASIFKTFALSAFLFLLIGCSTAKPKVGVRPEFQKTHVKEIGIIAVYSTGQFSLDDAEFSTLKSTYTSLLEEHLRILEFKIFLPDEITSTFSLSEKNTFEDGMGLPKDLYALFELEHGEAGAEVQTLKDFYKAKKIPAFILFAEIVYHAQTMCYPQEDLIPHAVNDSSISLPTHCALSHLHLKLIDSQSGSPVWSNHFLYEFRSDKVLSPDGIRDVVRETIKRTLQNENGITQLR